MNEMEASAMPDVNGYDMQEDAQYIDDDVPAFYDAMAEEMAAFQEQEMQEQILGDTFFNEDYS